MNYLYNMLSLMKTKREGMNDNFLGFYDVEYLWKDRQEKGEKTGVVGEEKREVLKSYIILSILTF